MDKNIREQIEENNERIRLMRAMIEQEERKIRFWKGMIIGSGILTGIGIGLVIASKMIG